MTHASDSCAKQSLASAEENVGRGPLSLRQGGNAAHPTHPTAERALVPLEGGRREKGEERAAWSVQSGHRGCRGLCSEVTPS